MRIILKMKYFIRIYIQFILNLINIKFLRFFKNLLFLYAKKKNTLIEQILNNISLFVILSSYN